VTHLTRDDLERWARQGLPTDRDRIVGHLAQCDDCAALYARVLDGQPVEPADDAHLDELKARAYGAYGQAGAAHEATTRSRRPRRPRRTAWIAASGIAAAILAALVLYPVLRNERPLTMPDDTAIRGASIQALAPAGTVSPPIEFRWSSPMAAARYELTVSGAGGVPLWSSTVRTERVSAPPELVEKLRGTEATWQVTALDEAGRRLIRSEPQRFAVAPRAP
jgi:hypothetical protein